MRKFLAPLTYADLAGRRRPRRYFAAGLMLMGLILVLWGWWHVQRRQAQAALVAWPQLEGESAASMQTDFQAGAPEDQLPASSGLPGPGGETDAAAAAVREPCPRDPQAWAFLDVLPGDHFKKIEPVCVYAELSRAVAWHLLERLGYSKPESAGLLGLAELPWQPANSILALTNTQGPLALPLTVEWPAHPDYRFWAVGADGEPGPAYSLRGCHRTRSIVAERVERWNTEYAALCAVAVDYPAGWSVSALGPHVYVHDSTAEPGTRAFLIFGYTEAGQWLFVGERQDLHLTIENEVETAADRRHITAKYGVEPWDTAWLAATYGLSMRPLPDGWQQAIDPTASEVIGRELSDFTSP